MATNPKYSNTCVNAEANAIGSALDNGFIRIYDGSQPADADTAVSGQTLLAEAATTIACVDRQGQLREIPEEMIKPPSGS